MALSPSRSYRRVGAAFFLITLALLGAWFNWEGVDRVGTRPPACSRLSGRLLSSSPHLSLSSAASRCFAGAITLPLAHPRRLTSGWGSVFLKLRLRYSELRFCDLVTTTSCRAGLIHCVIRPIVERRPVPFCVRIVYRNAWASNAFCLLRTAASATSVRVYILSP